MCVCVCVSHCFSSVMAWWPRHGICERWKFINVIKRKLNSDFPSSNLRPLKLKSDYEYFCNSTILIIYVLLLLISLLSVITMLPSMRAWFSFTFFFLLHIIILHSIIIIIKVSGGVCVVCCSGSREYASSKKFPMNSVFRSIGFSYVIAWRLHTTTLCSCIRTRHDKSFVA